MMEQPEVRPAASAYPPGLPLAASFAGLYYHRGCDTYYACEPGSQAKGKDLSKCTPLLANAVAQIKASGVKVPTFPTAGTPTGGTGTPTVDTDSTQILVSTPSGKLLCPVTAFSASKTLNPSACKAATSTDKEVRVVCVPPVTVDGNGVPTTGSGTGSTSSLNCSMPSETYSKNQIQKIDNACPGGGTRTVTGGYDAKAGTLDITVKLDACIDKEGNAHTGTVVMQGMLTLQSGSSSVYDMNETKTVSSSITFKEGGQMSRTCTINRTGSYDDKTGKFSGTVTRNNCSLTGDFKFHPGLIDTLLSNAGAVEPI